MKPIPTRQRRVLNMSIAVDLLVASESALLPTINDLERWVNAAAEHQPQENEISIRLIDKEESASLNQTWRDKEGPTNVLSFPAELPEGLPVSLLGDLAICAPVVEEEAEVQSKTLEAHWAHIVIHGTLHLLGYDHIDTKDAIEMESLETHIMNKLGYSDPYQTNVHILR